MRVVYQLLAGAVGLFHVAGQALQGCAQFGVADTVSRGLDAFGGGAGKHHALIGGLLWMVGGLDLEQDALQTGEFLDQLQLPLQATLLVAQACRPVAVSDY